MIITVTMNPAIDKTGVIDNFQYGGLNRIQSIITDIGGKGINVSKAIHSLGGKSVAAGFIGGNNGVVIEKELKYRGIQTDFTIVNDETRCNLKLIDKNGAVTEMNEPGPEVDVHKMEVFLRKLERQAGADSIVVLTGSLPNKMEDTIYRDLTDRIHRKGGKVFLDADGEAFAHGLEAKPEFIKPNRHELQNYLGRKHDANRDELLEMGRSLQQKGIKNILLSLGKEGAMFLLEDMGAFVKGLEVEVKSSVGAGDALLASYVLGVEEGLEEERNIKRAVAASAGAVMTAGTNPPSRELIEKLEKQVNIEYLY